MNGRRTDDHAMPCPHCGRGRLHLLYTTPVVDCGVDFNRHSVTRACDHCGHRFTYVTGPSSPCCPGGPARGGPCP
ncbi:hypothetical protein GCM10010129_30300 [Streptomyces fumigatiscleroticus]|nr:hypothetical protein GCM10010129_30300 [Streptomyces fumigatiscleroticus]